MASWAYTFALKKADLDRLSDEQHRKLLAALRVSSDWRDTWRQDSLMTVLSAWRRSDVALPEVLHVRREDTRSVVGSRSGSAARSVAIPSHHQLFAGPLGGIIWWHEGGATRGARVNTMANAENNVLSPYGLGDPAIYGSSAW